MSNKTGLIYFFAMVFIIYALPECNSSTTPMIVPVDTVGTEVSKENLTAPKTLTSSQLTTKSIANDATNTSQDAKISTLTAGLNTVNSNLTLVTANLNTTIAGQTALQKTVMLQAATIASQASDILITKTSLKAAQDTISAYRQVLDGAIFQNVNGVTTISYFLNMRNYMIQKGMIAP